MDDEYRSAPELLDAVALLAAEIEAAPEPDDTREGLAYVWLASLAFHFADLLIEERTESFLRVFELVERMLLEGSPQVQELMTVGFIEDLQNATLQRHRKLDAWDQWLGVETRYWWDAVIRVWAREKVVLKWPRQH